MLASGTTLVVNASGSTCSLPCTILPCHCCCCDARSNLVAHLREAAGQLRAPAWDAAAHAARTVARCLALANEAAYTYEVSLSRIASTPSL